MLHPVHGMFGLRSGWSPFLPSTFPRDIQGAAKALQQNSETDGSKFRRELTAYNENVKGFLDPLEGVLRIVDRLTSKEHVMSIVGALVARRPCRAIGGGTLVVLAPDC